MKNVNAQYVALIGDAVASRDLSAPARRDLQHTLRAVLDEVNRRWRRALAARFAIALGDQFEGLLADANAVWDISHFLRAELASVDWVIVCARGRIATSLARSAPEVDGPVFHAARAALDDAKRRRLVFAFTGFDAPVPAFAAYYSALYWSWTGHQRRAAALLRIMEPAAAARRLDVGRSAVSHLVRRLGWDLVAAGDEAFREALERSTA